MNRRRVRSAVAPVSVKRTGVRWPGSPSLAPFGADGMTLAQLNEAEARVEVSPRVPLLLAIRDKLALALREES